MSWSCVHIATAGLQVTLMPPEASCRCFIHQTPTPADRHPGRTNRGPKPMDRTTMTIDPSAARLRRVGRLARRRMRLDSAALANGIHTDGTLTVEISGLNSPVAGVPDSFEWEADRPIALVIVRS